MLFCFFFFSFFFWYSKFHILLYCRVYIIFPGDLLLVILFLVQLSKKKILFRILTRYFNISKWRNAFIIHWVSKNTKGKIDIENEHKTINQFERRAGTEAYTINKRLIENDAVSMPDSSNLCGTPVIIMMVYWYLYYLES